MMKKEAMPKSQSRGHAPQSCLLTSVSSQQGQAQHMGSTGGLHESSARVTHQAQPHRKQSDTMTTWEASWECKTDLVYANHRTKRMKHTNYMTFITGKKCLEFSSTSKKN